MPNQMDLHMAGHIFLDELDFVGYLTVQIEELLVAAKLRYLTYARFWRVVMPSVT